MNNFPQLWKTQRIFFEKYRNVLNLGFLAPLAPRNFGFGSIMIRNSTEISAPKAPKILTIYIVFLCIFIIEKIQNFKTGGGSWEGNDGEEEEGKPS